MSTIDPAGAAELGSRGATERPLLIGTVLGDDVVLHDATLTVGEGFGKRESRRNTIPCSFEVQLDSGATVRVNVSTRTAIGPRDWHGGQWKDIADEPLAAPFAAKAPGDQEFVRVKGVAISGGDRVAIAYEVEEQRPEGGGYRVQSGRRLSEVKAEVIGLDEDEDWVAARVKTRRRAAAAREESARRKGSGLDPSFELETVLSVGWAVLAAALGLAGVVTGVVLEREGGEPQAYRSAVALGLFFLTLGLFTWRCRRFFPRMLEVSYSEDDGWEVFWSVRPWASNLMGWGIPVALVFIFVSVAEAEQDGFMLVAACVTLLFVAITLWVVSWRRVRVSARALRRVASARPASGDGWGRHEGTVVEGKMMRRRMHRKTSVTYMRTVQVEAVGGGTVDVKRPTTVEGYDAIESGGRGTLKVDLGDRVVDVELRREACWGTTRRFIAWDSLTLTEQICPGDHVVLLGDVLDGRMWSTEPGMLIVFGSHRGPARSAALRALWAHRAAMLGFAAVVALGLAFTALELGWL